MKFNYDFPFTFYDLRNKNDQYLSYKIKDKNIVFSVDLGEYDQSNEIEIALEIENSSTFYRKMFILNDTTCQFEVSLNELGNYAKYALMLVAKCDGQIEINNNSDYYETGDCIGILEDDRINLEEEKESTGLIKVGPTDDDTISFDLTGDWITIELPKEAYEKFYPWQKDDENIPYILASLGANCIQFAIIQAMQEPNFKNKKWFETLEKLLENKNYQMDDFSVSDIPGATNKILDNCFEKMINVATSDADINDTSIYA